MPNDFLSRVSTSGSALSSIKEHEAIVNQGVSYRGYTVYHDGNEHVAEPVVSDGENFEISALSRERLYGAIDELWAYLDDAQRIDQPASVPAWYQAWLDDGADGRIRISDDGMHESIAPNRGWWGLGKLLAGALVCGAAFLVTPNLDVNGDGSYDREDLASLVEKVHLAYPPKSSHRHIRFGERVYDVNLVPAPEDEVDFDARDIQINGVSVKRAAGPQASPTMSFVPYMASRP